MVYKSTLLSTKVRYYLQKYAIVYRKKYVIVYKSKLLCLQKKL
jgi:hypothetical protein